MIILFRPLLIITFFTFFNKKTTPLFLLFIVIAIRVNISGFFLCKNLSFLGLIWVLVYLGGMIVIFIYICFLFKGRENKIQPQSNFFFKKNFFLEMIFIRRGRMIFFICFYLSLGIIKKSESIYSLSLNFLDWEVYNSITITRLLFIIILITIILISLINILRLLKKSFIFYQKNFIF